MPLKIVVLRRITNEITKENNNYDQKLKIGKGKLYGLTPPPFVN